MLRVQVRQIPCTHARRRSGNGDQCRRHAVMERSGFVPAVRTGCPRSPLSRAGHQPCSHGDVRHAEIEPLRRPCIPAGSSLRMTLIWRLSPGLSSSNFQPTSIRSPQTLHRLPMDERRYVQGLTTVAPLSDTGAEALVPSAGSRFQRRSLDPCRWAPAGSEESGSVPASHGMVRPVERIAKLEIAGQQCLYDGLRNPGLQEIRPWRTEMILGRKSGALRVDVGGESRCTARAKCTKKLRAMP